MDVTVNISNTLAPVKRKEFGRSLIVTSTADGTKKDTFLLYDSLEGLSADFAEGTAAYNQAQALFSQTPRRGDVAVLDVTRDPVTPSPTELSTALNALLQAGQTGWYFLLNADREQADGDRAELADWVSAQERMYIASEFAGEGVSDLVAAAAAYVSNRVVLLAHDGIDGDGDEFFDGALAGRIGAKYPGSVNWRHLMLNAITKPGFTVTDRYNLEEGNVMTYWENPVGHLVTTGGMATSNFWADLTRAIDFVASMMREKIWDALSQQDKIPYTDEGILYLASLVVQTLEYVSGFPYYIIARDLDGNGLYKVEPPARADIDPLDAKNRILPNLPWWATAAGAINQVTVNGILTEDIIEPVTGEYS